MARRAGVPVRTAEGVCTFAVDVVNQTDDPELRARGHDAVAGERAPRTEPALDLTDATFGGSLAEAVPMALMVLDAHGRMEFGNEAARTLCDLPHGPTEGRFLPDLAIESDRPTLTTAVRELLGTSAAARWSSPPGVAGSRRPAPVEARLLARGQAGQPSAIVVTLDDVTERRREEDDLRRAGQLRSAHGPPQPGSPARGGRGSVGQRPSDGVYCDLVGFKAINDTFGHAGGDDLLVEVATLLTSLARSTDAIGRLGGDEFVVLCDGLTKPHTATLVARLDAAFDAGLGVRISVGVASSAPADRRPTSWPCRPAMYAHKRRTALSGSTWPGANSVGACAGRGAADRRARPDPRRDATGGTSRRTGRCSAGCSPCSCSAGAGR